MKIARFLITPELLRELLHLPVTTEIVWAGMGPYDEIELTVKDPGLREVELVEGARPPLVTPLCTRLQVDLEDGDLPWFCDRHQCMVITDWGQGP